LNHQGTKGTKKIERQKKNRAGHRSAKPGVGEKIFNFVSLVEHLPYGASMMQEKRVARVAMGTGLLIMAVGASLFAIGWGWKLTWLVEIAFVITLIGWMMVIIGFAFWVVSSFAKKFPVKQGKS
jgi:hypothetical protein